MSVEQAHVHLSACSVRRTTARHTLTSFRLGREICTARKPYCWLCPLREVCDYARSCRRVAPAGVSLLC